MTVFGMAIVDTWLVNKALTGTSKKQKEFYRMLAEALIDNPWGNRASLVRTRNTMYV